MKKAKTKLVIVVHAAIDRRALCEFSKRDPSTWPAGHRWVHPKFEFKDKITCRECLKKTKKIK